MLFIRKCFLFLSILGFTLLSACPSKHEQELENARICNIEGIHVLGKLLSQLDGVHKKESWGMMIKPSKAWRDDRFSLVFIDQKITRKKLQSILKKAESFFESTSFVVWIDKNNHHLIEFFTKNNCEKISDCFGRYKHLRPFNFESPPCVEVRRVVNEKEGKEWARVTSQVYAMDEQKLYAFFKESYKNEKVYFYVGYLENEPMSARMMFVYPHPYHKEEWVSTGYLAATLPKARRQGLAAALVRQSFVDALKEGANFFVTQAPLTSKTLWEKMESKKENNNYLCFKKKNKENTK